MTSVATKQRSIDRVVVIHQDHYFTKPFLPYEERVDDSYENGSGIDWERLVADVRSELGDECCKDATENEIEAGPKVLIVEGHLLGDATMLFREKILGCQNIGILGVFLLGCSQESCKHRRLMRKKDRSDDERNKLSKYIDTFVWPSFLSYGVSAMKTLRQDLDTENTKGQKSTTNILEINNSEGASFEDNASQICDWIHKILST